MHRDIKPSNILLAPDDRIKLTDFGIASRTGDPRLAGERDGAGIAFLHVSRANEGRSRRRTLRVLGGSDLVRDGHGRAHHEPRLLHHLVVRSLLQKGTREVSGRSRSGTEDEDQDQVEL